MRLLLGLVLAGGVFQVRALEPEPLEAKTSPFDFDSFRRNTTQARQTPSDWASRNHQQMQQNLTPVGRSRDREIAARAAADFPDLQDIPIRRETTETLSIPDESAGGRNPDDFAKEELESDDSSVKTEAVSREQRIAYRAAALFSDLEKIPIRQADEPPPSPTQFTDEVALKIYGQTTKGQRDLLSRSRLADRLDFSTMSPAEYDLFVASYRAGQESVPDVSGEGLLRPMPALVNSKTGGPPHGYAVSQAGVGARVEPRNGQNPFEDLLRALRLDQPVSRGTDPLPTPSKPLTVTAVSTTGASATGRPETTRESPKAPATKP